MAHPLSSLGIPHTAVSLIPLAAGIAAYLAGTGYQLLQLRRRRAVRPA